MRLCIVILILSFNAFAGAEADKALREMVKRGYQLSAKKAGFVDTEPGDGQNLLIQHASLPESPKYKKYWEHAPHNKENWQALSPENRKKVIRLFLQDRALQAFYRDLRKSVTMDCQMGMEQKKGLRGWSTKVSGHSQRVCSKFLFDRSVCLSLSGGGEEALQCNLLALQLFKRNDVGGFEALAPSYYQSMLKLHQPQILQLLPRINHRKPLEKVLAELNTHRITAINRLSIQHALFQSMDLRQNLNACMPVKTPSDLSTIALIISFASSYSETSKSMTQTLAKLHATGGLNDWIDKEWARALMQLLVLDEAVQQKKSYQQVQRTLQKIPKSYLGDDSLWVALLVREFKLRVELDLLKLILSCRIHQLKHGRVANDLQTLKKDAPALSITDPFTAKEYGYKVSDKVVTVFSTGPDGERGVKNKEEKSDDISISLEVKR